MSRILLLVVLLAAWASSAIACPEMHGAPAPASVPEATAVPGIFAAVERDHRCECSATMHDAQSIASNSDKSMLWSYVGGSGAIPNSRNPDSIALAVHARSSGFIARHPEQPSYLLVARLRQ